MNMAVQLTDIYRGFEAVVSSPKFKNLPIIIGECDPEGCAACSVMYNPQNAYRNGTVYSSYTAASYSRIYDIADKLGVNIEGAVSWSFEFEDQPWFAGFRDLATNGIDKPVLNVFRMFGMMRGERLQIMNNRAFTLEQLQTNGVHDSIADVHALATADKRSAYIMVWNYYDDDIPALDAELNLQINSIPSKKIKIEEYSIDEVNSNSYSLWKKMGSPQNVYPQQYGELEKTGKLKLISEQKMNIKLGSFSKTIQLPRQAVKLIKISW
jgi:xylan 1,4-beta-xylosidase